MPELSNAVAQEVTPDSVYLNFGKIFKVAVPRPLSFSNPHDVAQYAVYRCSQGETKQLLAEMEHVEKDIALGKAFITFIREFGPDLERYKGKPIYLKFHGYFINQPTTVWYYYLVDEKGNHLEHDPWISIHRSRSTGMCALTGIFLYEPEDGTPSMPKGLITSEKELKVIETVID
jgi:hypothetical protein